MVDLVIEDAAGNAGQQDCERGGRPPVAFGEGREARVGMALAEGP